MEEEIAELKARIAELEEQLHDKKQKYEELYGHAADAYESLRKVV